MYLDQAKTADTPSVLRKLSIPDRAFLGLVVIAFLFMYIGLAWIPFHPDEATYLFISSDLDNFLTTPIDLTWVPGSENDIRMHYRLVDPPLIRYLTGISLALAGEPALPTDWDWTQSWEVNRQRGALPSPGQLHAGRFASMFLIPWSMLFLYLSGREIKHPWVGLLAAALLASNALILLHDRRVMSESVLTLGISLSIYLLLISSRNPFWLGIGIGLAVNAKQTAWALLPVGFLAVYWAARQHARWVRRLFWIGATFLLEIVFITLVFNPFTWRNPVQALAASFTERQILVQNQVSAFQTSSPETLPLTIPERLVTILAHLLGAKPATYEIENYASQTRLSEEAYFNIPGHLLFRGPVWSGVHLTLILYGVISGIRRVIRKGAANRWQIRLLLAGFIVQFIVIVLVPFPFQRYTIALVPWFVFGRRMEWLHLSRSSSSLEF